jgi:hypothetical protein
MNYLFRLLATLILIVSAASTALCASIVGLISDQNGNPVNGVRIVATDASGKAVGDATSDLYGRYCVIPLDPGNYTLTLDPGSTGVNGGTGAVDLGADGATTNWSVSNTVPGNPTSRHGIASAAEATCADAWWESPAALAAGLAFAGGLAWGLDEAIGDVDEPSASSSK